MTRFNFREHRDASKWHSNPENHGGGNMGGFMAVIHCSFLVAENLSA